MNIPADEQAHYDAARKAALEADQGARPRLNPEQQRYLQLVSRQATHVLQDAPDLLGYLERLVQGAVPTAASNAAEVALFRQGIAHALATIRNAADWPGESNA